MCVFERGFLGVPLDRRRAGSIGALRDRPGQDLGGESRRVCRHEVEANVVANDLGDSFERVVAERSMSELG